MLTTSENTSPSKDEELVDVLMAISVIAKWLAKKLQNSLKTKGEKNEQTETNRRID